MPLSSRATFRTAYDDLDNLNLFNILYRPEKIFQDDSDLLTIPGYQVLFHLEPAWRNSHEFKSRLHLDRNDLTTVSTLIRYLDEELERRASGFRCVAMSLFMQIVCFLSRCHGLSTCANTAALLRIGTAISELEKNYTEPIDLDKLAAIANMTKRSLLRAFKKAIGVSPIAYLIEVRIRRATDLLQRDDLSITEVAQRVGFEDSNYFARQFRTVMGTTPTVFRRNLMSRASST